jgi:hypothetical protein
MTIALGLLFIAHSRVEAVLTVAIVHPPSATNGNRTLSMRRYLARLTHHKPEIM